MLGYELEDANSAGNGLKLFGDLTGGFGGLLTSAGLSQPKPFEANTTLGDMLSYHAPGVSAFGTKIPTPTGLPSVGGSWGLYRLF